MKVADLKVGELYKIRSDRETHVSVRSNILDVHLGTGDFKKMAKIRPLTHLIYLGHLSAEPHPTGFRWVMYRGKKMRAYPNIWQHITPIEEE